MPRRRSSAQRSGSMPVSARTRVDLPWSTCPAVATTRTPARAVGAAATVVVLAARSAGRAGSGRARPGRRRTGRRRAGAAAYARGQRHRPAGQREPGRAAAADRARRWARPRRRPPRRAPRRAPAAARGRPAAPARPAAAGRAGWPPARRAWSCRPAARGPAGGGAAARRRRRGPSTSPACGPPSSLSPLQVTTGAPARSAVAASGSSGSSGSGREQAAADVGDDGHARASASSATPTALVKPSTRKLLGCTLRTQPVSGPTASA